MILIPKIAIKELFIVSGMTNHKLYILASNAKFVAFKILPSATSFS